MESIKHKPRRLGALAVPDFRNLGVILRLVVAVNLLALITVLLRVDDPQQWWAETILIAGRVELPLLLSILLLYLVRPLFPHLGGWLAPTVVLMVVLGATALSFPLADGQRLLAHLGWAALATLLSLLYFDYRHERYSPALAEARLQALTARIRPHFFFNSLNGVLGVIRSDPRRAERALEELADLFRVLMRDNRELVALGEELALCERYIDLERLRLDERLQVHWQLPAADSPEYRHLLAVRVPLLLLQPLLENAVYHGIEPCAEAGEIFVRIGREDGQLCLEVDNPLGDGGRHHGGNRMALDNIRERLMLFFDLEARLESEAGAGRYRVRIRLPWREH